MIIIFYCQTCNYDNEVEGKSSINIVVSIFYKRLRFHRRQVYMSRMQNACRRSGSRTLNPSELERTVFPYLRCQMNNLEPAKRDNDKEVVVEKDNESDMATSAAMDGIAAEALRSVLHRVNQAAECSGRGSQTIRVVAVSKTKPVSLIRQVYDAGHRCFGENYVQEIVEKAPQVRS